MVKGVSSGFEKTLLMIGYKSNGREKLILNLGFHNLLIYCLLIKWIKMLNLVTNKNFSGSTDLEDRPPNLTKEKVCI